VHAWREPSEEEKKRVASNPGPPTGEQDFINAGIYILEPEVIDAIPAGRSVSIERETYPMLLASDVPVYGIAPTGYWMDIGRPEQFVAANEAVLSRLVTTGVPFERISPSAAIHPSAEIDENSVIGPGVHVGENCRISRSIILDGSTVGSRSDLAGVIADKNVHIGEDSVIRSGAILAEGCIIRPGTIFN
jgi:NDP-sugar pyrophosphorylase family protein